MQGLKFFTCRSINAGKFLFGNFMSCCHNKCATAKFFIIIARWNGTVFLFSIVLIVFTRDNTAIQKCTSSGIDEPCLDVQCLLVTSFSLSHFIMIYLLLLSWWVPAGCLYQWWSVGWLCVMTSCGVERAWECWVGEFLVYVHRGISTDDKQ